MQHVRTPLVEAEAFGFHPGPIVRDVMAAVPARIEALGREAVRVDGLRSRPDPSA